VKVVDLAPADCETTGAEDRKWTE